jgi:hypothetical protein
MSTREAPSSRCLDARNDPVECECSELAEGPSCSSLAMFVGCRSSCSEGLAGCGSGASAIKSTVANWFLDFPRPRTRNRQTPEMSVINITRGSSVRVTKAAGRKSRRAHDYRFCARLCRVGFEPYHGCRTDISPCGARGCPSVETGSKPARFYLNPKIASWARRVFRPVGFAVCFLLLARLPRRLTRPLLRAITSTPKYRRCSSVVEQRIRNARVVGSIPTTGLPNSP